MYRAKGSGSLLESVHEAESSLIKPSEYTHRLMSHMERDYGGSTDAYGTAISVTVNLKYGVESTRYQGIPHTLN